MGVLLRAPITGHRPSFSLGCCCFFCSAGPSPSQMMSTDTAKVDLFCGYMHFIWSGMEQVAVAIALLIRAIGPPALAGLGVVIIMIPFQGMVIRHLQELRKATVKYTDRRVKLMNEILQGIRVIKVYACTTHTRHLPPRTRAHVLAGRVHCSDVGVRLLTLLFPFLCVWRNVPRHLCLCFCFPQGRTASFRR